MCATTWLSIACARATASGDGEGDASREWKRRSCPAAPGRMTNAIHSSEGSAERGKVANIISKGGEVEGGEKLLAEAGVADEEDEGLARIAPTREMEAGRRDSRRGRRA